MNIQSPKKRAVQDLLSAIGRGDENTFNALVTEDFTHEFLGSTVFATKLRDRSDMSEMMRGFRSSMVSDGEFTVEQAVEEGDLVIAFFTSKCELTNGRRYDGVYAGSFRFRDDRIASVQELMDTKLADSVMA